MEEARCDALLVGKHDVPRQVIAQLLQEMKYSSLFHTANDFHIYIMQTNSYLTAEIIIIFSLTSSIIMPSQVTVT